MLKTPIASNPVSSTLREIPALTVSLSRSLRHPTRNTLSLIDQALSHLIPFESAAATVTSSTEMSDLLELLDLHRMVLAPYADIDRIEWNLKSQLCHL